MRKIILLFFVALSLLSCTSENKDSEVILFNDITFKLNTGEESINIDSKIKEDFHSNFKNMPIQLPLYKCIKSDNYMIYLGIPFNTSIKKLADYKLENSKSNIFFESDSTSYLYSRSRNEDGFITEYSKSFDKNIIYVLTVSNSSELSDSLFNKKALPNRFNN